jgi:hypothetical protein
MSRASESPVAELIPLLDETATEPDINAFLDRLRALYRVLSPQGLQEAKSLAIERLEVVPRVRDPGSRVNLALGLFGGPTSAWPSFAETRTNPCRHSRSVRAVFGLLGGDPGDPRCPRCAWPLEWAEGPAFPGDPSCGVAFRCKRAGCVLESWSWVDAFVSDALRLPIGEARKRLLKAVPDGRFSFERIEGRTGHRARSGSLDRERAASLVLAGGGAR